MSGRITRDAYRKMVVEDLERLRKEMPSSLERDHIDLILQRSVDLEYGEMCSCGHDEGDHATINDDMDIAGCAYMNHSEEPPCPCEKWNPVPTKA